MAAPVFAVLKAIRALKMGASSADFATYISYLKKNLGEMKDRLVWAQDTEFVLLQGAAQMLEKYLLDIETVDQSIKNFLDSDPDHK